MKTIKQGNIYIGFKGADRLILKIENKKVIYLKCNTGEVILDTIDSIEGYLRLLVWEYKETILEKDIEIYRILYERN